MYELQLERNVINQRIRAVCVTRSYWNDKSVISFENVQTSHHSSDFRKGVKPLHHFMHSAKPLERQARYSFRNYTDRPSQRFQARREATSVTARSYRNDKSVLPFGIIQTGHRSCESWSSTRQLQGHPALRGRPGLAGAPTPATSRETSQTTSNQNVTK